VKKYLFKSFNLTKNAGTVSIYFSYSSPNLSISSFSSIITLVTENVDEVYNKLINKGLKIAESPKLNKKFNIYHFFIKDPNGYTIEIQRFLEE